MLSSGVEAAKEQARNLLQAGSSVADVVASTGLKRAVVLGLKGAWVKAARRAEAEVEEERGPGPGAATTVADQLKEILTDMQFKKTGAVIKLVESYGYNILGIYSALKDSGARLSVIRYAIKRWAAYNNEEIPRWMAKEIEAKLLPSSAYPLRDSQLSGEVLTEERLQQILERREKEKEGQSRLERIEATQKRILEKLENPGTQKGEVQELKEEIKKMRQDEVTGRLDRIEKGLTGNTNELVQGIKSLENIALEYMQRKKKPLLDYLVPGEAPIKEVEEGAAEGIFNYVRKEYVAES